MKFSAIALLAATASGQDIFLGKEEHNPFDQRDNHCVSPGICHPPMARYSKRATLIPRD